MTILALWSVFSVVAAPVIGRCLARRPGSLPVAVATFVLGFAVSVLVVAA